MEPKENPMRAVSSNVKTGNTIRQTVSRPQTAETTAKKFAPAYMRFSGLAFQMLAIIGCSCWGGIKLDQVLGLKVPVCTIVLSLTGVALSMYFVIIELKK